MSEEEIPLMTKFEEEVLRLNDQVKYVRSSYKRKHVKTCRKGILGDISDNKNNDMENISMDIEDSPPTVGVEEEDQSSDEELPLGLTPMKYSSKLSVKDIVWAKWGKWPFLPAMVKKVYHQKKRLTLIFFTPENEPMKPFTISMGNCKVIPYHDPRGQEILNSSEDLPKEERVLFDNSVQRLSMFFMKKASNDLYDDWSFFKDADIGDEADTKTDPCTKPLTKSVNMVAEEVESKSKPVKKIKELSKKGQRRGIESVTCSHDAIKRENMMRKEKMNERTKELTKFVLSDKCKEYLVKVYKKEVQSERHQVFLKGSAREKCAIKDHGFGPIDDDEQIEEIILTLHTWFKEINKSPYIYANDYVFDVWAPEAIVFGLKKLKGYSTKKAWEMFSKGVKSTKEELDLFLEWMTRKSPVEEEGSKQNFGGEV